MAALNRREWLRTSSLAAFGLGLTLPSMANEEGITRNFGSDTSLINLGSNENPYGISPLARKAIVDMFPDANRYQFNVPSIRSFREPLANHFGLSANQILITAGSGEALSLLARHFSKGNIVLATPTFGILGNSAKKLDTKLIEVPLTEEKVHDLPAMMRAINDQTQLVYIVNPANPTGTIVPTETLRNFCIEAAKKTVVLIDEAYVDFLDDSRNASMMGLLRDQPNIVIVRTFSKIHGMAGLRVGFVAGHPSLIQKLEENYFSSTQYTVSNLTIAAALASLGDKEHARSSREKNAAAREFTQNTLRELGQLYIPSSTNFIFFKLKNYSGDFARAMLAKNIVLRSSSYPDGKWCRVSIGTMQEMQQFAKVIKTDIRL
ncbi:MAG TPA: aminotransferase class I/II-fold pyridoxal phosphate-dependent enzyme [Flavitalea sp.]|nr:aminotransferase class I/II-fold pyridoxal phosphate-dependent enzyme [Flavitalea sp.]